MSNAVKYCPNDGRIALVGHANDHELTVSVTMPSLASRQPSPTNLRALPPGCGEVSRRMVGRLGFAICKGLVDAYGGHFGGERRRREGQRVQVHAADGGCP